MSERKIILPCTCGEFHLVRDTGSEFTVRCKKNGNALHYECNGNEQHLLRGDNHDEYLLNDDEITIGRKGTWAINYPLLSREHCVLRFDDGQYFVRDAHSRNGTFVNEEQLNGEQWVALVAGDLLRLADLNLRYLAPHVTPNAPLSADDLIETNLELAAQKTEEADRMIGKKLGEYKIYSVIAQGGMGRIYYAKRETTQEPFVIKTILPEAIGDDDDLDEKRQRFLMEMDVSLNLQHPNLIKYHDVGQKGHFLYIVMEYFPGRHLRHWFTYTPATYPQIISIGMQTARALAYAHTHGIVHRDIKPENILYHPPTDCAKIIDFGVAKGLNSYQGEVQNITATNAFVGTLRYMSPEQAMFKDEIGARSDIFSLGATLYFCLAGRAPFEDSEQLLGLREQIKKGVPPLSEYCDGVPEKLAQAIEKALPIRPQERYQNATEFADALAAIKL